MGKITSEEKKKTSKEIICFHCGDICREDHVIFEDNDFCCNGCKTVYEILKENDLCNYYDLENNPGITLKSKDFGEKYNYLDNSEIQEQILDFKDDNTAKVNFYIPVIHCSSCIWLLENLYKLKEGIRYSRVNFTRKEVYIDFNPNEISLKEVVMTLSTIGYEPFISLEQEEKKTRKSINRSLIIKIGVAGFSFGNIMLLSFPEYFGFEGIDDVVIQKFILWLNVLLSLPVVFYCSTDYFKSAFSGLKQKYINIDLPISLGIITLFLVSLFHVIFNLGPGYFDSLSGLLFFLLIGKWVQNKTYEGLSFERDYRSYFPLAVNRIENGKEEAVPVKNLKKSDTIRVRNGEIIPADSILLSKEANIDYSFVTGESDAVHKNKDDLIYAGGRQEGASVLLQVQKPVSQSYLTQLWNNEAFKKEENSEFESLVNRISKYFTITVLFIALGGLLVWLAIDMDKAWFVFTAVLIVACPCALSLSTPFTLGNTMNVFGRNRFYLKNTMVIEKLTHISHIVFDKTGTLTENYAGRITFEGKPLNDKENAWVTGLAANSTHPLSRKLIKQQEDLSELSLLEIKNFKEIKGKGILGEVDGHQVKIGSLPFMNGDGMKGDDSANDRISINEKEGTNAYVSIDGDVKGAFRISNLYRKNIQGLIRNLTGKYKFSVLSGDHEGEKEALKKIFPDSTCMFFNQKPEDKLIYINTLQEKGDDVLMLGDGLNDAGALVKSNTGIAVTEDITSFTPASDAILDAERLSDLDRFLHFSGTSRKIIYLSFVISFLYNIIGMGFAVFGKLTPIIAAILMPLSSISVVFFATFAVNTLAKIRKLI
jgi:Cu+-exporting ATPase